jgi:pyridinium-3,5-biscarboxylic acid mononucleotide sulfurtransferase
MGANEKLKRLRGILKKMDGALLAFSGGVDSSFLLKVATTALKDRFLAVTWVSQAIPGSELEQARALAKKLKVRHLFIAGRPPEEFWKNYPRRCYYCKKALFGRLKKFARGRGLSCVLDGSNADDSNDFRPGTRALKELGIRSPLKEAGMNKQEIRRLSRAMGLANWNRPAMACLASRIPYGEKITARKLSMIDKAEELIRSLGFDQVRVRLRGQLARIEVAPEKIVLAAKKSKMISARLKSMGFAGASIDLDGYRRGSLNEGLAWTRKR